MRNLGHCDRGSEHYFYGNRSDGTYDGEKELTNSTWYPAENAACAQIGEKVFMVKGYECDFGSDEVQSILGSLRWN